MISVHPCLLRAGFLAAALLPLSAAAQSDSFTAPTVITVLPVTGTNAGATKESGEPRHGNNDGGASVWYSWTAPASGHYRVDLLNSVTTGTTTMDTLLGLYGPAASLAELVPLAQNDDRIGTGVTSAAVVHLNAGETILIAADGYKSTAAGATALTGTINLNITLLPVAEVPPVNDLFSSPADLGSADSLTVTVNTAYGSREVGEPLIAGLVGGSSLWWTWTAPVSGDIEFNTTGTPMDTLLAVYTGTELSSLSLVTSNDNNGTLTTSKVTVPAVAGTQYRISADIKNIGLRIAVGNITLRIGAGTVIPPLTNDNFAAATVITALPLTGTNAGATKETGEPNHASNAGGASVWYRWTAPADGHYRVDLLNSTFDTLLGVYTGAAVGSLLPVTQNDDRAAGSTTSTAVVYARTGQEFFIAVDGFRGTAAATGNISLNISLLTAAEVPPANDLFASPASLGSATSAVQTVSTVYGSREAGEPLIESRPGFSSLWWTWTATASGDVEVNTAGTAFNTLLAVYTGTTLDALTLVASNDNFGSLVTSQLIFPAVAGTTYRIAADVNNSATTTPSGGLTLRLSSNVFIRTLVPAGSTWAWLHPSGAIDPAGIDPDFATTWHTSAAYDGPAFNAPGGAILGYGGIDYGATVTNIIDPGTGNRYGAYFRRNFTATEAHSNLKADILADDGAFIYIDGLLAGEINMGGIADTYTALALNATNTENTLYTVELGAITAGPHEVAVSIHNSGTTSSDLGFDLRLYTDSTPPPTDVVLGPGGAFTGFEEPFISSASYLRGSNGAVEIGWTATGGSVQAPASHPAAGGTPPVGQFFRLNSARTNPFRSDRISLTGLTDEEKSRITASTAVRTFINTAASTSTFEIGDDLTISLEGSTDGTAFTVLADVLPLRTGGTPDELLEISAASGDYVVFTSLQGIVTPDIAFLRLSIIGGDDSASEYIYLDNLRVEISAPLGPGADTDGDGQSNGAENFAGTDPQNPQSVLRIASATVTGNSLDLTFPAVDGKSYLVEYAADPAGTWTTQRDNIAQPGGGAVSVTGLILPDGSRGFVRVRVKP